MIKKGRPPVESERVTTYLTENPQATNKDVMVACDVAPATVSRVRKELVEKGMIPPAWGDRRSKNKRARVKHVTPPTDGTPFETQSPDELIAAVEAQAKHDVAKDLDLDEEIDMKKLKRILWRIAQVDPDNRIRTQAIWTLTRVQAEVNEREAGPGVPMTKQQVIARLLDLFEGVGAGVIIEAMQLFLDKRKGLGHEEKAVESGGPSSPSLSTA